ncbi:MAG: prepilin peptidase [Selenomonadaceae bacterium]|nr:prepilin peptidase [Selenomonadaceae bacterium]
MEIFFNAVLSAMLTFAGSMWIDKLYCTSTELTFPEKISERSKFRKPLIFCALTIFFCLSTDWRISAAIFLLTLMTFTDFEQYMLFDSMTLPLAIIGVPVAWQTNFFDGVLAAVIGGGIFLLFAFVTSAIGGGDVKLIAALGFWLGCEKLLNVVLIGSIAGGISALLMILAKKKDRNSYFAYGPYFTLTAIYFLLT